MAGELFQSLFLGEFILFLNQGQTYPATAEASEKKMWTLWRYFKQMFLNLQNFTSKWTLEAYTYSSNGKVEILCTQFGFWVLWKVSLFLVHLPCLHPRSVRQALKLLRLSHREIAVIFFLRLSLFVPEMLAPLTIHDAYWKYITNFNQFSILTLCLLVIVAWWCAHSVFYCFATKQFWDMLDARLATLISAVES